MLTHLALLPPAFTSTLVYEKKGGSYGSNFAQATVLTEGDLVGGFDCDFTGHHGETDFAKPFVWVKGKLSWLPLGKGDHGRVWSGDDKTLYGEVMIKYGDYPAMWTPDPKLGWAKAKLTIIGKERGSAFGADSTGNIWVTDGHGTPGPVLRRYKEGKHNDYKGLMYPVGIDQSGQIWGNRFDRSGMWPDFNIGLTFANGKFNEFKTYIRLAAVNVHGVALGIRWNEDGSKYRIVTYENGTLKAIPLPQNRLCRAVDINDSGDIVGYYVSAKGKEDAAFDHPVGFLWKGGRMTPLASPDAKMTDYAPALINNRGSIVTRGSTANGTRIYLLR